MGYISNCGPFIRLLGGYQTFSNGTMLSLRINLTKNHFAVRTLFRFVKISSWDNETFSLDLEGTNVQTIMFNYNSDIITGNLCGDPNPLWLTAIKNIEYLLNHTEKRIEMKFSTNLDQNENDKSWGVKDLLVTYYTCYEGCDTCIGATNADCDQCINTFVKFDGKCLKCDANCQTCSVNATHCDSCSSESSNKYLANNQTCVEHCSSLEYSNNLICTSCSSSLTNCLECANSTYCLICNNTQAERYYYYTHLNQALCLSKTYCSSFIGNHYPDPKSIDKHFI